MLEAPTVGHIFPEHLPTVPDIAQVQIFVQSVTFMTTLQSIMEKTTMKFENKTQALVIHDDIIHIVGHTHKPDRDQRFLQKKTAHKTIQAPYVNTGYHISTMLLCYHNKVLQGIKAINDTILFKVWLIFKSFTKILTNMSVQTSVSCCVCKIGSVNNQTKLRNAFYQNFTTT